MSIGRATVAGLLAAALSSCAGAPERRARTVEAEGWAPVAAGDESDGRARALAAAQKRAVEEATGVRVAAATRIDGAVAVRQRVWADTAGRLESWTVLKEWAEDGFHKARIRAVVAAGDPPSLRRAPGGVKVAVVGEGAAGPAVRRALSASGFELVSGGAEYVARFRAASRPLHDTRLGAFSSSRARVTVEISDAATGAVVCERAGEASALGDDSASAAELAAGLAAEAASREAAEGLTAVAWTR